jgi:hypothetical protein
MKVALIESRAPGTPKNPNLYAAYDGFEERGVKTLILERSALLSLLPELAESNGKENVIVCGNIGTVREALAAVQVTAPPPLDYPESLQKFLKRKVWRTTLGEFRAATPMMFTRPGRFLKPADHHKTFTGHVVHKFSDLIKTNSFPDDLPVWESEPIEQLVSEFRVFVMKGSVLGMKHYLGASFQPPCPGAISSMMQYYENAPVAYSLDVGVNTSEYTPQTVLIEVNDAFALGSYGLPSALYAQMIEARWAEMVRLGG